MFFQCKSINFCYLCSSLLLKNKKRYIGEPIKLLIYKVYSFKKLDFIDCNWSPKFICEKCRSNLYRFKKEFSSIPKYIKPKSDHSDCFFCMTNVHKYNHHFSKSIISPPAFKHCALLPELDNNPQNKSANNQIQTNDLNDEEISSAFDIFTESFEVEQTSTSTKSKDPSFHLNSPLKSSTSKIDQKTLNDTMRLLNLSKEKSHQLACIFKELKFLDLNVNTTFYKHREEEIVALFSKENGTVYMNDINGYFKWLKFDYHVSD